MRASPPVPVSSGRTGGASGVTMVGMLTRVSAVVLAVAIGVTAATAQVTATKYYRVVNAGGTVRMDTLFSMDPDCRSLGRTTVSLIEQPKGGSVTLQYGSGFSNYVSQNPRWACNRRRSAGSVIAYRANTDFTGEDSFVVEEVFPEGVARTVRYYVNVR